MQVRTSHLRGKTTGYRAQRGHKNVPQKKSYQQRGNQRRNGYATDNKIVEFQKEKHGNGIKREVD